VEIEDKADIWEICFSSLEVVGAAGAGVADAPLSVDDMGMLGAAPPLTDDGGGLVELQEVEFWFT